MKKKKPTKTKPSTPEFDSERETRVLLEKISSDVKTVAEGHSSLVKGQEEIKSELSTVKAAVWEIDTKVKGIDTKVNEIGTRLKKVEQKLDSVTENHEQRIQKLEAVR